MLTKQQNRFNDQIKDRKDYLKQIEHEIEEVTTAGNNKLLVLHGEIDVIERKKATLLKENLELEQKIRENRAIVDSIN